jgi:hypothetical protein
MKDFLLAIYYENETVKMIADRLYLQSFQLYCFLIDQRTEPIHLPWISTSWIEKNQFLTIQYKEKFTNTFANIISADIFGPEDNAKFANLYFSKTSNECTENQLDPIVIFKTSMEDGSLGYIVRRGGFAYNDISLEKSNVRLLSIEYTYSDKTIPIELELENAWFYSGNELFTSTFVLRCLEYQSLNYLFDNDYVLKIMDADCTIFTLTSSDYLLLKKDGYEVKHIQDVDNESEEESDTEDTITIDGIIENVE